jgi:hypothetical protein
MLGAVVLTVVLLVVELSKGTASARAGGKR